MVAALTSREGALAGSDAVVHCAGINREIGRQTYQRAVHVELTQGTRRGSSSGARVRRIVMISFLRARPDCGSAYHESKWDAEQLVRKSALEVDDREGRRDLRPAAITSSII